MNRPKVIRDRQPCIWLNGFERNLIMSDELKQYVAENKVQGVLTNFASLERSLHTTAYDQDIQAMQHQSNVRLLYDYIRVRDMQLAADLLKRIHNQTNRYAGYVSLDLPPQILWDAEATLIEARRLWQAVGWSNFMLSIPAIPTMLPVVEQLITEGINVNVTLLFSQGCYEQVVAAYIRGLEALAAKGGNLRNVISIVSFPIAALDEILDSQITAQLETTGNSQNRAVLESLLGRIAIAQAKIIHQFYQRLYQSPRWQALASIGANQQRLLWTIDERKVSTSRLSVYIESLMSQDIAIALSLDVLEQPIQTRLRSSELTKDIDIAQQMLRTLEEAELSIDAIANQLIHEAIKELQESFDQLLITLEEKRQSLCQA